MTKKLISFALALVLCMSLSMSAFAGNNSKGGQTSGGTAGTTSTSAYLSVGTSTATASTYAGTSDGVTCNASIIYYYLDPYNNTQTYSDAKRAAGSVSVPAYNTYNRGVSAKSQHTVTGGSRWGNWSCSLSANAI